MNEFFSKDHLRKKTCNVTRQQHLQQGLLGPFTIREKIWNVNSSTKRTNVWWEIYPPLSFLQPQTAKDDGWPLKNNFNFIQPTGEAQCQATVTIQNFINPLYFLPLFALFFFTHKWPRKSFQWNTLASWLAEPKRDEHTNKNCQDSRKALDKRTFFKWLCCSIKCKVISSRPLLYS